MFVSSTTGDLSAFRALAGERILRFGWIPLMMERFPAGAKTLEAIQTKIDEADAVLLIAGRAYGSRTGDKSFVEHEYELARKAGKLIIALIDERPVKGSGDPVGAQRQQDFHQRLRASSRIVKGFKSRDEFGAELTTGLRSVPDYVRRHSGLVAATSHLQSMEKLGFARALFSLALLRQAFRNHPSDRKATTMTPRDDRQTARQILELLEDEETDHPVTLEIMADLIASFIRRLHSFTSPAGFVPESMEEFKRVLEGLFSDSLRSLQATSIHSTRPELSTYKGYWEDPELGDFFQRKNAEFLEQPDSELQRVYACDSLANAVAEEWFREAVVAQVRAGAAVKVAEINPRDLNRYEDFGIYRHDPPVPPGGTFLLLAPVAENRGGDRLQTMVTPEAEVVGPYVDKFDGMWGQSREPVAIIDSDAMTAATGPKRGEHGRGSVHQLFGDRVVLRKMYRLDTGEALLPDDSGFVRKYEPAYAEAVAHHIKEHLDNPRHVLYIGDTYKNDGTAIRNLQARGLDVSGFICEPELQLDRLWFNSILYSSRWTDVVGFVEKVRSKIGRRTLAIFDIDQTLWAPKGSADKPLALARTDAIANLVDLYVSDPSEAAKAKARILALYHEISKVEYIPVLTLDNEDYKAAICVFIALSLIWEHESEHGDPERGVRFLASLDEMSPRQFINRIRPYLAGFAREEGAGTDANMVQFLSITQTTVRRKQYRQYAKERGIDISAVTSEIDDLVVAMGDKKTVKYGAFRAEEYKEALRRTSTDLPLRERIVISKAAWDLASWLKDQDVTLLALSDRPEEATVPEKGPSLLEAEMTIYGRPVRPYLDAL